MKLLKKDYVKRRKVKTQSNKISKKNKVTNIPVTSNQDGKQTNN
jgi:hypothetical protein